MRKIIVYFIITLIIIFLAISFYSWINAMERAFSKEGIESRETYCRRQIICDECNRKLKCLLEKCGKEAIDIYGEITPSPMRGLEGLEEFKNRYCSQNPPIRSGSDGQIFISVFCFDNQPLVEDCTKESTKLQVLFEWRTIQRAFEWPMIFFGYGADM